MTLSATAQDPAWRGDVKVPGPLENLDDLQGQWPRMLELSEDVKTRLQLFLDHEIRLAWQERDLLVTDWTQWQKDYWAKPAQKVKNFPFRRAANIVIPMTAIAVEAIYARLLTTLFSAKPFYSIRPRTTPWIDVAPNVEAWLQTEMEDPNSLDIDSFVRESLLELIKFGTGIGKSGYEKDLRKVNVDLPDGTSTPKWITRKNGATLDYVPLANFLMRLFEKDPQTALWVGEDHTDITWSQLKRHALSGRMYPEAIESIRTWFSTPGSSIESSAADFDAKRRENEHDEPAWADLFNFTEVWLSFDVDGDGVDEEIVIDFHTDSRTILSARYNWYSEAHRPYRIGNYIPVEGRWTGIGVGKQLEQFQALITTIHRQRLDAGTLANMGQLALKKNSGYGADEPIWPGKIWLVDNPATDIAEFHLSNTQHFAQLSNEDTARNYADKRSGANELILGTPTVGTPPTATSDLAKLAEGNKKFDMVLKNVRRWYSLMGGDALANYQQFGSRGRSWLTRGEDGELVETYLTMPQESVRRGAFIELTVTDSITNKDVEQRKWLEAFQVLTAHYDKVLERAGQVAGILGDPTIFLMFAEMALKASNAVIRRFLSVSDIHDIDTFLLDLDEAQKNAQSGQGGGGAPGANQGSIGTTGSPGGQRVLEAGGSPGVSSPDGNGVSVESF